jgi:hypothetical protein
MKKAILAIGILISLTSKAQKVSDTLLIKIDTTTYKYVLSLIQENIDGRTMTGKTVLGNIIQPLQKFTFLQPADKPKELPSTKQK